MNSRSACGFKGWDKCSRLRHIRMRREARDQAALTAWAQNRTHSLTRQNPLNLLQILYAPVPILTSITMVLSHKNKPINLQETDSELPPPPSHPPYALGVETFKTIQVPFDMILQPLILRVSIPRNDGYHDIVSFH